MRIYLSGKITGRGKEDYTRQFARSEQFYKSGGFDVVNPVTIGEELLKENPDAKWEDFMKVDLKAMEGCTHIAMLEGWEESKGANAERTHALNLNLEVMYLKFFN